MKADRRAYLQRLQELESDRTSWEPVWRDVADHILPWRARFDDSDVNRGDRRDGRIINSTGVRANRILAAGMMAGMTSPARPWFRLGASDPDLGEFGPVRMWLHTVEEAIRQEHAKSNLYHALAQLFVDLGGFGAPLLVLDEDREDGSRAYVHPVGRFYLATNDREAVDTVYRVCLMTAAAMLKKFGFARLSRNVQDAVENGRLGQRFKVIHVIEPRVDRDPRRLDNLSMPWRSAWFEHAGDESVGMLAESGYRVAPFMAPRWAPVAGDVYSTSPGIDTIGDVKGLQKLEHRKFALVDKVTDPPMKGPASMRADGVSILPGAMNYVDETNQNGRFEPALVINPGAIQEVRENIHEHTTRVNEGHFVDLFLMLANDDRSGVTAREVVERHEEKMLQLGPVLESLQDELLEPIVDRTFDILLHRGDLPEPPPELQGTDLKVEYISILAQAQKLLGITSVERVASFAISLAQVAPDVVDKLNTDQMMEEVGRMTGVKPAIIRSQEEVDQIRAKRQQAQQAQAQGEAMVQGSQAVKNLAGAPVSDDNALNRILGTMGPIAAQAGGANGE